MNEQMTAEELAAFFTLLTTGVAAMTTKFMVDLVTMAKPDRATWVAPAAAVLFGIAFSLLQVIGMGRPLTLPIIANAILAGVLIAGIASGLTSLGNSAEAKRQEAKADARIDAEEDLPAPVDPEMQRPRTAFR